MNIFKSQELFKEAREYFPGGVNSPVRAFGAVGGNPRFMVKGEGVYLHDADGNKYLDFCASWGPLILGHAPEKVVQAIQDTAAKGTSFGTPTVQENELARLILKNLPHVDKIRFVSSGTEAVMSALRLARAFTGRSKIIKFHGCYHGHSDALLAKAGSGLATSGLSDSAGVPQELVSGTLVLPLNNRQALEEAVEQHGKDLAAVLIEPVPANNGLLVQDPAYLQFLRELCTRHGILLLFDEVISGFRLGFSGAAGHYQITPDLVTYGKIIGGGLPVGAYGGRADIMARVAPEGPMYQAGTLSGNPLAMAAGYATLRECLKGQFYEKLEDRTRELCEHLRDFVVQRNYPVYIEYLGSVFWIHLGSMQAAHAASDVSPEASALFKKFYPALLDRGVYMGPSGYEVGFVSAAHTSAHIKEALPAFYEALDVAFDHKI